jgi:hypothetical protein
MFPRFPCSADQIFRIHPKTLAISISVDIKKPSQNLDFTLAAQEKINNSFPVMHRYLPLALVAGLLVAFRALGSAFPESLPNFQPLAAVFFCGAILASGWRGFAIPLAAWAITYPLGIGHVSDGPVFTTTLLAFVAIYFLGKSLATKPPAALLAGSVAAALAFHIITNTAAWLGDPMYGKSLTGLWQSLWTGPAGSPLPSWVFLRNLAAANFLFTGIVLLARFRLPRIAAPATSTKLAESR